MSDERWAELLEQTSLAPELVRRSNGSAVVGVVPDLPSGRASDEVEVVAGTTPNSQIVFRNRTFVWACGPPLARSATEEAVMARRDGGGRKEAWAPETRAAAIKKAMSVGPEKAGKKFGIPAGTIRSWLRRAARKAEQDADAESGLEEVKRIGAAIVAEHEAQLERYGPPPLAVGEYLSPDPYEGQRPPPGTPWPPFVPEPVAEEPVEDAVTSQLVPGEAASSDQLLSGEEPKPKKKRGGGNDDVV
jgi:hypothetical protein